MRSVTRPSHSTSPGAHVGVLTQLAFGFSPKFVKSERCDPQNHERRMSTVVFYISSDSESEEQLQPADSVPGAEAESLGNKDETDKNKRYSTETLEQSNVLRAFIAVSPARVIAVDSQARGNGEVLANSQEADCLSDRCVDAMDGKIKVEYAHACETSPCSSADSLCQSVYR
jgi:hypothetical protein